MYEDFSEEYKLDENGLVDLEYNKARYIHFFGEQRWNEAMAAIDALDEALEIHRGKDVRSTS